LFRLIILQIMKNFTFTRTFFTEWFPGVIFLLIGVWYTFSAIELTGLFYVLMSAMLIPPIYTFTGKYIHAFKKKNTRTIFVIIFLILALVTSPRPKAASVIHLKPTPSMEQKTQ